MGQGDLDQGAHGRFVVQAVALAVRHELADAFQAASYAAFYLLHCLGTTFGVHAGETDETVGVAGHGLHHVIVGQLAKAHVGPAEAEGNGHVYTGGVHLGDEFLSRGQSGFRVAVEFAKPDVAGQIFRSILDNLRGIDVSVKVNDQKPSPLT